MLSFCLFTDHKLSPFLFTCCGCGVISFKDAIKLVVDS